MTVSRKDFLLLMRLPSCAVITAKKKSIFALFYIISCFIIEEISLALFPFLEISHLVAVSPAGYSFLRGFCLYFIRFY